MAPFTLAGDLFQGLAHGAPSPDTVRVIFWPRDEIPRAHERWPQLVQHTDTDTFARDREMANRELSQTGVARIVMVPLTASELAEFAARTGGDPVDETTRRACMEEIINEGGVVSWPPPRNAPCWCGSGTKYKKCRGTKDTGAVRARVHIQLGLVAIPKSSTPSRMENIDIFDFELFADDVAAISALDRGEDASVDSDRFGD